jgi:DNA-binding response OmpR family regulator
MRVLVADDDPVSLRLLQATVVRLKHEAVSARDGQEAWELFQGADFPLVITDWLMPRMSGIELCQAIRAEPRDRYSYIVLVTSLSDRENTLEGFGAGADDYLVKPVSVEQLEMRTEVAARVRSGMDARVEMTMRHAVEMAQQADGEGGAGLVEGVRALTEFYRTRRAHTKARAFLRRQIALAEAQRADPADIARFQRELDALRGLDDDPT